MALRWASTQVAQYARRTWVQFVGRKSGKPVETIHKNGRPNGESHRFEARSRNKPFEQRQSECEWKRRLDEIIRRQKCHENSLVARCQRLYSPTLRLMGSLLARGVPAYGFVGVVLANGSRGDVDVHGYDSVCRTIQNLMIDNTSFKAELEDDIIPSEFGARFADYEVGKMIGQGCNAAVYEAKLKANAPCDDEDDDDDGIEVIAESEEDFDTDAPKTFPVEEDGVTGYDVSSREDVSVSEESASFEIISGEEDDNLSDAPLDIEHQQEYNLTIKVASNQDATALIRRQIQSDDDDSFEVIPESEEDLNADAPISFQVEEDTITRIDLASSIPDVFESEKFASFEIISDKENDDLSEAPTCVEANIDDEKKFDLAIKITFNYGAASNSHQIMQNFKKEAIPAKMVSQNAVNGMWENGHPAKMKLPNIPPHPNIVDMHTVFVGDFPLLAEALIAYPMALPARLNPDGCGRNKTMFLVMKKYETTLSNFVESRQLSSESSCLLLLQLLEGVLHMSDHRIAHRDLKGDNILLDVKDSAGCPRLVVSDFGCCLASDNLRLPYSTDEISIGGNLTLMAPEIVTASPGVGSDLDYSKTDVWSAGTLAYEIFGQTNPFYRSADGLRLNSYSYDEEDLPPLYNAPEPVQRIVRKLLMRDQEERPDAKTAANMMQIVLWGPKHWLESIPHKTDVVDWLVVMAAKVLFRRTTISDNIELQMKHLFLSRLDFDDIMEALYALQAD
ncbi:serine/threonine-protein kinase Pink1, mitochondrial-like [Lineus longissimus]|uniref:serine/threonine-protein kinase Pink1, mitochondrial-like n=1 Tax=Lineus longissimus TaxID=88925 RepID=UPI002B4CB823